MGYSRPSSVRVTYHQPSLNVGTDWSVSWMRDLISANSVSTKPVWGANHWSVWAFSAFRYAMVSGSSRLASQWKSSAVSPVGRWCT